MDVAPADRCIVLDACPLCGGRRVEALTGSAAEFEWVRCACTLVFKRSERTQAAPYDATYFERYARRRRHRVAKARRQIRDALEVAPPGPLLDVGCSLGYTLEAARGLGVDADGVDVSDHAIRECRRRGLQARAGTLTALGDGRYAVAMLKHVFEHTPAPRDSLAELRRVLMPQGAAFFAVPHAGYFKAVRTPEQSAFFRGRAGREHYVYYSPETLTRLLAGEGFRVASVHPVLVHRRAPLVRRIAEMASLPLRVPARIAAGRLAMRKEFWLVAVRT